MFHLQPIKAKQVLQIHPHVDGGWFWSKYSAQPYMGCSYGCTYCFLRANIYGLSKRNDSRNNFSKLIQYKINSAEILDKELENAVPDIITLGDYQPAESGLHLSRKLLKICLKHRFPVLIVVKSALVLQDLDIMQELAKKSWVGVVFSIAKSSSRNYRNFFEPNASTIERRFEAMRKINNAGIYTGISLMPVMPGINDNNQELKQIVKLTRENGGQFVIGGGLTLLPGQKSIFYNSLKEYDLKLLEKYRKLYGNLEKPKNNHWAQIGRMIKNACIENGVDYRIKRFIPESHLKINKQISTEMFLKIYEMELNEENLRKIWNFRRATWEIDELKEPISFSHLSNLKNQSKDTKKLIEAKIKAFTPSQPQAVYKQHRHFDINHP
ncbi:MAG: radical SAM protein [Patescibacteria group bacterium]